jgi:hypothetical protein
MTDGLDSRRVDKRLGFFSARPCHIIGHIMHLPMSSDWYSFSALELVLRFPLLGAE